jgi:molybdenum-dependent DNA-binding transcriptional regulator ModE
MLQSSGSCQRKSQRGGKGGGGGSLGGCAEEGVNEYNILRMAVEMLVARPHELRSHRDVLSHLTYAEWEVTRSNEDGTLALPWAHSP